MTSENKSFRDKILHAILLSTFSALLLTCIGLVLIESWLYEQKLDQDTHVIAKIVGNRSLAALEFGDKEAAYKNLESAKEQKHIDAICLYDIGGVLFAEYNRAGIQLKCSIDMAGAAAAFSESHFVVNDLTHFGEYSGSIVVAVNHSFLFEGLKYFIPMMLILIVVVLIISTAVIKRVLWAITRPLEDLHATAQSLVEDANSDRRVTRRSDDEIGELVEVFNRMLDNLASENLALQSSENRFRTLTAHAPIGIFQLDSQHNLTYANDHWYKITETQGEQQPWAIHQRKISQDDHDIYRSNWERSIQKDMPVLVEYRYQKNHKSKPKFLMENIAPLHGGAGMDGMIGTLADVTELKNAQKELEKLAFYDPLTGLPNRRFFMDLLGFGLAKAKRSNTKSAVLMLDMDNFKKVNDLLGHGGGDQLLQQHAQRIRAAVREQDAVSRMGGDEFTVMLSPVGEISEVTALAKRILDALNTPVVVGNHTLELGASIGVSIYPDDGETVDDLIRNADMALYEAKAAGRNRVNFFSYKLDLELRESLRIEQKLKHVIRDQGLETFLQPQVSGDGKVLWAEALVRWFDEDDGPIAPDKFIPLAEETGLIHGIGQWMLEQVCFHLAEHKDYLAAVGINGVSVNLSGRQFYSRTLLKDIKRVMAEYGVNPELLEFELTESSVMDDVDMAIDVMSGIRDMGCKLAIDDFGTGYSSLSYLKRFPINNLKIDRSFVIDIPHDEHGSAIATTIIAMAHKLHLGVVAEGVETEEQQRFLVDHGCELLQGYLFAKPAHIQDYVNKGRETFIHDGRIVRPFPGKAS